MKINEVKDYLQPLAEKAEIAGDKYCFFYFSREQDAYSDGSNMDSGDALMVVTELMERYGIQPDMLGFVKTKEPFATTIGNESLVLETL